MFESKHIARIHYEATNRSGIYELAIGPPINRTEWYAVNVDPRESSLDYVDQEELENDLLPGVAIEYLTQWQDGPRRLDRQRTKGQVGSWLTAVPSGARSSASTTRPGWRSSRPMSRGVLQIAREQPMNIDDPVRSAPYRAVELRIL